MLYYALKVIISAIVIVAITEIAKRNTGFAALVASLPLTSLLAFIWLYIEGSAVSQIAEEHNFNTLGGFVMRMIGRIPVEADYFESTGWRFEVVDMDKTRVDKVLVTRSSEHQSAGNGGSES